MSSERHGAVKNGSRFGRLVKSSSVSSLILAALRIGMRSLMRSNGSWKRMCFNFGDHKNGDWISLLCIDCFLISVSSSDRDHLSNGLYPIRSEMRLERRGDSPRASNAR